MAEAHSDAHDLVSNSLRWRFLSPFMIPTAPRCASRVQDGILLVSRKASRLIPYREVRSLSLRRGLLGRRLVIRTADSVQTLRGLRPADARPFFDALRRYWVLEQWCVLDEWHEANRPTIEFVESLKDLTRYARQSKIALHRESLSAALADLLDRPINELGEHPLLAKLPLLTQFVSDCESLVSDANDAFIRQERIRFRHLLETIESNPLTDEQQVAVVTDEDRNLVVAAAGSGKTSVIIAKIAHILNQGDLHPSQLLVLAFNRAARDELRQRIAEKIKVPGIEQASVMTFHGLGYWIIGRANGKKPSVAKHAGDIPSTAQLIREIIDELCSNPRFERHIAEWFAWHLNHYKSAFDFETVGEYYEYLEQHGIVTLKGERVKSFEECLIANFLSLKGIDYKYEAPYELETADAEHRQYQPDFYLPDHRVYIEHFGLDRNGHTAPFVDEEKYHAGTRWKRAVHEAHGTHLIETFSYQRREGTLLSSLEAALVERGVNLTSTSAAKLLKDLRGSSTYDRFSRLIAVFLGHYISNGEDRLEAMRRAIESGDAERADAFLAIFWPVFERYRERMTAANEVDFEMMIRDATEIIESGRFDSSFRYILVDEFQDISVGRAKLLRALVGQSADNQLFAVGDDWQSIYRFAGSDISAMRHFGDYFGATARSDLSTTFRCNQKIADLSSRFVTANPAQLRKAVKAIRVRDSAAIFIWRYPSAEESPVAGVLRLIQQEARSASVLVLGRYRHDEPEGLTRLATPKSGIRPSFQTVHSAKGLEADYVVVVGMAAGKYGFPSEIEDDPLMELVLAEQEGFEHAEERRLFYVAVTRARHAVFLLAPEHGESSFIRELESSEYTTASLGTDPASLARCPVCKSGVLSVRLGQFGSFCGCSNFPRCATKTRICPACEGGVVDIRGAVGICSSCSAEFEACPGCAVGYLQLRHGPYSDFWGCSSYPDCAYTRSLRAN